MLRVPEIMTNVFVVDMERGPQTCHNCPRSIVIPSKIKETVKSKFASENVTQIKILQKYAPKLEITSKKKYASQSESGRMEA